mgnify:FL=1
MLLNWLSVRHHRPALSEASKIIDACLEQAIDAKETTRDIGGNLGTNQTGKLLIERIKAA